MGQLEVNVDPSEVGLDPGRLARLGTHLKSYVDDGRLPGWTVVVTRSSDVAYVEHYGKRDLEVALDLVRTDYGKQTMDNARRGLDQLQAREAGSVSHRLEGAENDVQLSRYGIGLLTAINPCSPASNSRPSGEITATRWPGTARPIEPGFTG